MERAQSTGDLQVGLALRDSSITIIGYCLGPNRSHGREPALSIRGKLLRYVGGTFVANQNGAIDYVYYPPTKARHMRVVQDTSLLADLAFPPVPRVDCPLDTHKPFRLVACQSLFVVEWASPLKFQPDHVELLDVDVWESGNRAPLGFFMIGIGRGPRGLMVRFGFQPPSSNRVDIKVSRVYIKRGGGDQINEITPNPIVQATIRIG